LVNYQDYSQMHGQQNIKTGDIYLVISQHREKAFKKRSQKACVFLNARHDCALFINTLHIPTQVNIT